MILPAADDQGRREFIRRWRRVGSLLEQIKNDELRALDDAAARRIVEALLQLGSLAPAHRPTSGLVEQQRRFQELHARARATDKR